MTQQAGYFLENIEEKLLNFNPNSKVLIENLCYFHLKTKNLPDTIENAPVRAEWAVLKNMLKRGLPTRMSLFLERCFAAAFGFAEQKNDLGAISFNLAENVDIEQIFKQLHIIEPRFVANEQNYDKTGLAENSHWERLFVQNLAAQAPFLLQLFEKQRFLTSIVSRVKDTWIDFFKQKKDDFFLQRVDFSAQFSYNRQEEFKGLVVEIDGSQHGEEPQKSLDDKRNAAIGENKWKWLRIKHYGSNDATNQFNEILAYCNNIEFIRQTRANFDDKNFNLSRLNALELALSPLAIARILTTLFDLLQKKVLKLENKSWHLAMLERDVPCAVLAILDWAQQLKNIFLLKGERVNLPKIYLSVFNTSEFKNCQIANLDLNEAILAANVEIERADISQFMNFQTRQKYDAVIDIAMLMRESIMYNILYNSDLAHQTVFCEIRNAHSHQGQKRIFDSAAPINYGELWDTETNAENTTKVAALTYFLQNIFRKAKFREGQIPILNRALQHKNVIGLLPTGGGKSMTYQMAALLQAGFSLVVAPIKSLMTDQVDNLKKNKIDTCSFINSNLSTAERKIKMSELETGQLLFALISPERFQVAEFRELLGKMYENKHYFQYVVIDEAHCVSEWGHDFRTPYLMLGHNAQRFVKPSIGEVCVFALTATASFDVLADVQRELSTATQKIGEEAVVRLESELSQRPELSYEVVNIDFKPKSDKYNYGDNQDLGAIKYDKIAKILQNVPNSLANLNAANPNAAENIPNFYPNDFYQAKNNKFDYAGLIFCSHKNGAFGVKNVASALQTKFKSLKTGTFMGSDEDDSADSEENQRKFINNESQLMIATKAFGMGIDKPNVRYTIHFNYPSSLESFVQEAGRAGRDRKWAKSYILFADNSIDKDILLYFYEMAFQGADIEKAKIWKVWQPIEKQLNTLDRGDYSSLIIPFSNIEEIKTLFETNEIVFPIIGTKKDYKKGGYKTIQNYIQLENDVLEKGKDAFADYLGYTNDIFQLAEKEYISKAQTEKALYRMLLVGAIDDYLIDYNKKFFTVYFSQKSDSFYQQKVENFLTRYYSIQRANVEIQKLAQQKGNSIIQKCFGFLIDFVYKETSKKRQQAIEDMREACLKYTKAANNQGESEFKDFLFYYFNSKYARKGYEENSVNQSLHDRTDEGKNEDIDWVWEFIGHCNFKVDNLKHLRGAAMVLLKTQPDNSTLLLLRAFATIVLEIKNENNTLIKRAIKDLQKGFSRIKKSVNDTAEYAQIVKDYNDALKNYVGKGEAETKRIAQIIQQINLFATLSPLSEAFLTLSNDFLYLSKKLF